MNISANDLLIRVQATPNPYAWKFVMNYPVKNEGKVTYGSPESCHGNILASSLFEITGVTSVHFFQNIVTITHMDDIDVEKFKKDVIAVLHTRMPVHDPNFTLSSDIKTQRKDLPEDLQKIESILDEFIRPALQGDGGDLEVIKYENNILTVKYQGACGSCPSSTAGTLWAIEGVLRDEFNPNIEVIPSYD